MEGIELLTEALWWTAFCLKLLALVITINGTLLAMGIAYMFIGSRIIIRREREFED